MFKIAGEAANGGPGPNQRISIGTYPLVSLADARQKASEYRDMADRGIDPRAEKQAQIKTRIASRIDTLVAQFIEHKAETTKNWKNTKTLLDTTVAKRWAGLPIDTIKRADIHDYLDELKNTQNAGKAGEVRKHLSIFLTWCADRGYIDANPMAGMKRPDLSAKPRERVLSMEELAEIWAVSVDIGYPFGSMIRTLILTGQRRNEVANLQRGWIYEDRIEIPAENYKTKTPQVVPLTKMAKSEIDALPRFNHGDFCFSTTNGRRPVSGFSKAKCRFDHALELNHWTFHDIRRSVATHMAEIGVLQEIIERVLGHKIAGVAGTYNRHSYFDQKLEALEKWQEYFLCQKINESKNLQA